MANIQLSLLIPTYNEADIIEPALKAIQEEFTAEECSALEILIVDDGTDHLPEAVRKITQLHFAHIEVIRNSPPLGKGKSLALGFQKARGLIVGFLDVDLSTPPRYIKKAVSCIATGKADIFIASRRDAGAKVKREQSAIKDVLGDILGWLARSFIFSGMRNYKDTQCGFKFYKNHIAKTLYHDLLANDGLNDLEVLIRANLLGYQVEECGVEWTDLRESKRSLRRILLGEMMAIINIVYHYKIFSSARTLGLRKLDALNKEHESAKTTPGIQSKGSLSYKSEPLLSHDKI